MLSLIVTDESREWTFDVPGVEVLAAKDYLASVRFSTMRRAKVFNLCRRYSYQSVGYYVSLLAEARGHKPLPSVSTMQDLRLTKVVRLASEDLDALLQRTMAQETRNRVVISIYFGRSVHKAQDRLCQALFNHFPAPLLRAELVRTDLTRTDRWRLESVRPLASDEIPDQDRSFITERARRYFARSEEPEPPSNAYRYELAILRNPEEVDAPSDERAIKKFVRAAHTLGIEATVIGRDELGRLAEYDALFIRETTAVNHHTYRFARRAEAEGLVVIDDPRSILRCTNKVYLAELFTRHRIPSPPTLILHRDNVGEVGKRLGFPCVLKRPDSSFSAGVLKAADEQELLATSDKFFDGSELVIAQAFTPSQFDWRIGVLNGVALFACKYHMVPGHWQIQKAGRGKHRRYGKVETLPLEQAPPELVELAVRASKLIGTGFYGVDIKECDGRFLVMEVNDNPNVDAGAEDAVLGDNLYLQIMQVFYDRLERRGRQVSPG